MQAYASDDGKEEPAARPMQSLHAAHRIGKLLPAGTPARMHAPVAYPKLLRLLSKSVLDLNAGPVHST